MKGECGHEVEVTHTGYLTYERCSICKTVKRIGDAACDHDWVDFGENVAFRWCCSICKLAKTESPFEQGSHTSIGTKLDSNKPRWSLLPFVSLIEIVRVLEFGAKKYSENNWQKVTPPSRYLDAAFRHLAAYASGEKNDPESGLHHLAHAGCCIVFLLWFELPLRKHE